MFSRHFAHVADYIHALPRVTRRCAMPTFDSAKAAAAAARALALMPLRC